MSQSVEMPGAVFTIWWIGLLLTLVVFVPLAVYLLHRTWRAARSIQRYAEEALSAAAGIASNTPNVAALETTEDVAADMGETASRIASKLETMADVLARRAAD